MLSIHVENGIAKMTSEGTGESATLHIAPAAGVSIVPHEILVEWIRANAEITICRLKHDTAYQERWNSED
jgi:hypothetical protein